MRDTDLLRIASHSAEHYAGPDRRDGGSRNTHRVLAPAGTGGEAEVPRPAAADRVIVATSTRQALGQEIYRPSPKQFVQAIVAELPGRRTLEDALAICLAFLEREPETYPRAAAKWASRFAIERRLTLTDAQLTLAALAALPRENARAGAEALMSSLTGTACGRPTSP